VDKITCKGPNYSPACLYDFTNKIRLLDFYVFKPQVITISNHDHFSDKTQATDDVKAI